MKNQTVMSSIDKSFLQKLWVVIDALRDKISSEQYMLIVIGILFLKYISHRYQKAVQQIQKNTPSTHWKDFSKNRDILGKYNCSFFVPNKARWTYISEYASSSTIGEKIDQAFLVIEEANFELRGLFDKNYNRSELDQTKLGQVVSVFTNDIDFAKYGEDIAGDIYKYFLGHFFKKQGQTGGEFYTPKSIVQLLVGLIEPYQGKIYDPACGTGGMFIQAQQYMQENNLDPKSLIVYGQEKQNKIWKLAQINLLLHGFNVQDLHLGDSSADTFTSDQHKSCLFDFVLVNPPFNTKKWGLEKLLDDSRWQWGRPPKNNANYAWLSHVLTKLNQNGKAGVVLDNGSLTHKSEKTIREAFIKDNKVDAIIALPDKLFFTNGIPACLWILNNAKKSQKVLMINAYNLEGEMLSKTIRELTKTEITKIITLYKKHKNGWKIEKIGFAKSVTVNKIKENDYSFSPGRYVGWLEKQIDQEKVKIEIKTLATEIEQLLNEFSKLVPKLKEAVKKALVHEGEEK